MSRVLDAINAGMSPCAIHEQVERGKREREAQLLPKCAECRKPCESEKVVDGRMVSPCCGAGMTGWKEWADYVRR